MTEEKNPEDINVVKKVFERPDAPGQGVSPIFTFYKGQRKNK